METAAGRGGIPKRTPPVLFLISFAIISFQIALLRSLSFIRYYHFSYLVIGTALLGFGASGTFLSLLRTRIQNSLESWISWLLVSFTLSIPACYLFAQTLPLDVHYLFVQLNQAAYLGLTIFILMVPFFLGALLIGIILSFFPEKAHNLYGINLLGSGAGGICIVPFMSLIAPGAIPVAAALPAGAAAIIWILNKAGDDKKVRQRLPQLAAGVAVFLLPILLMIGNVSFPPDQYKPVSMMRRLEKQGDAQHLYFSYNGRSRLDLFSSSAVHQTFFAAPNSSEIPPAQEILLEDGDIAGIFFDAASIEEVGIMDYTPQSLPYRLLEAPRVLLLGDSGNVNVWLAERFEAREVVVVHPDPRVIELISERIPPHIPVQFVTQEPRLFLEQRGWRELFDIIHITGAEAQPAAAGGLGSLNENHLLTEEGMTAALLLLSERGMLSVTRGIQNPPRDSIKLFRLFARVGRRAGMDPADHILQSRNYLAVATQFSRRPLERSDIRRYLEACSLLSMDAEYYPGIPKEGGKYINSIDGPEGDGDSWYRFAALAVAEGREKAFDRTYLFKTDPPTDNIPYFHHFFTGRSLGEYIRVYGGMVLQRIELGYLILVFSLAIIAATAFVLILLPLLIRKTGISGVKGKIRGTLYFSCIGFAFMFLEIASIQKFGLHLGSPVFSAAAVITSILVFAGLGSIAAGRASKIVKRPLILSLIPLLAVIILYLYLPDLLLPTVAGLSPVIRFFLVILLLAPPAFFMGWFFPIGLSRYGDTGRSFLPFAWGINGFASVAASPLALLLSMELGFRFVMILAALLYAAAALTLQTRNVARGPVL